MGTLQKSAVAVMLQSFQMVVYDYHLGTWFI